MKSILTEFRALPDYRKVKQFKFLNHNSTTLVEVEEDMIFDGLYVKNLVVNKDNLVIRP